jgi:hypothetical protein
VHRVSGAGAWIGLPLIKCGYCQYIADAYQRVKDGQAYFSAQALLKFEIHLRLEHDIQPFKVEA